ATGRDLRKSPLPPPRRLWVGAPPIMSARRHLWFGALAATGQRDGPAQRVGQENRPAGEDRRYGPGRGEDPPAGRHGAAGVRCLEFHRRLRVYRERRRGTYNLTARLRKDENKKPRTAPSPFGDTSGRAVFTCHPVGVV